MSFSFVNLSTLKFVDKVPGFILDHLIPRKGSPTHDTPSTILIIKLSAMGDLLCLMPSIRELHRTLAGTRIDLLTTARSQPELLKSIPYLSRILLMPSSPFGALWFLIRKIVALRHYELIIDYDQSYRVSELIARIGMNSAGFTTPLKGASFAIQVEYCPQTNEKVNFFSLSQITCKHYRKNITPLDPKLPELLTEFKASPNLLATAALNIQSDVPTVIIYPGSSSNAQFRRWPIANYLLLARKLISQGFKVIFAGGPDEVPLKTHLLQVNDIVDWINKWTLLEWAWLYKNYRVLLVGSDGGLFHLADLLGTPSITIFGPSSETKWGSLNPNSVSVSVSKTLTCRPCIKGYLSMVPQECWKGSRECLTSISYLDIESHVLEHFELLEEMELR